MLGPILANAAYDIGRWESFAVAEVGAAAALAGLLVVASSINLREVLPGLAMAFGVLGGLYWLVPGVLLAFFVGIVNSWVALVEILR